MVFDIRKKKKRGLPISENEPCNDTESDRDNAGRRGNGSGQHRPGEETTRRVPLDREDHFPLSERSNIVNLEDLGT
jgi:hypothetical protein